MKKQGDGDQAAFVAENRVFLASSRGQAATSCWRRSGGHQPLAHGEHHGMRYTFGNRQHVIGASEILTRVADGIPAPRHRRGQHIS
jgi:hypothetical protein